MNKGEDEKIAELKKAVEEMTKTVTEHEARIEELERRLQITIGGM